MFDYNLLTVNFKKTSYLPFTTYVNNLPNFRSLNIENRLNIPEADSMKYLGIIIDKHFRWDLQAKYVAQKIRGLLYRFKYLKPCLDIKHQKILY